MESRCIIIIVIDPITVHILIRISIYKNLKKKNQKRDISKKINYQFQLMNSFKKFDLLFKGNGLYAD